MQKQWEGIKGEGTDTGIAAGNCDSLDRFARPKTFAWKNGSTGDVLDQVDYTYDYAGNRLTHNVRVDLVSGSYADTRDYKYAYDGLHRLTNAQRGTYNTGTGAVDSRNLEQRWTLDQLGNWPTFKQDGDGDGAFSNQFDLDQDREHNAANELGQISGTVGYSNWIDPEHDAAGNMTKMPRPAEPFAQGLKLKYDAWNRLTEVRTLTDYLYGEYAYDGLGQRIKKNTGGSTNHRDYYYNDQWQLLTEVKDGNVLAVYHWHPFYIDALAVRMTATSTHFFLEDANFNVTAAVDDATNAVVERYAYTPYGEVTVLDENFAADANGASDIGNTHFYTGRERDPVTGLQLNRHRYYANHMGRWVNRDPIANAGGNNLYEYAQSKGTVLSDPSGLIPITCRCTSPFTFSLDIIVIEMDCASGTGESCCKDGCEDRGLGAPWPGGWDTGPKPSEPETVYLPPPPSNLEMGIEAGICILGGHALKCICKKLKFRRRPPGGNQDPGSTGPMPKPGEPGYDPYGDPYNIWSPLEPGPPSSSGLSPRCPDTCYNPWTDPDHIFSDPFEWPDGWTP